MRMSMVMCKQTQPLLNMPSGGGLNLQVLRPPLQKERVVVVMGATGTGKSRLSIDLATRFPAEIVNSDKIQVYEGLDVVTNKITEEEMCGVPHHLLGTINPNSDFTANDFRHVASLAVKSISARKKLPIIVGGSNSYIEALIDNENYECCFLWVDVSLPVLNSFVSKRVDRMVDVGMVDEVRNMLNLAADIDYSRGIRRAIGVPEFDRYFRLEPFIDDEERAKLLEEVISDIKNNTRKLACRQLEKIYRLRNIKGWKLHRLDATDVFRKRGKEANEAWDRLVAGPSSVIVSRFLYDVSPKVRGKVAAIRSAMAAAASH
ncbi:adenylate isopentenyltransferase 3, chloroplastic [Actinidia eriantha]|uniref:adenylate isopentenyltransferase 3, chloroplastic n=1 Tax=Actinidia eriantha TaxID=165200 RepID=UPI00258C0713|nr:adenylate isopentenyltransferase 3, chloroplastic [Actinidia eriantha]